MATNRTCVRCGRAWPVVATSRSMERLRLTQRGWQCEGSGWVCPTCQVPFADDTVGSDAELRALHEGTAAMGAGE